MQNGEENLGDIFGKHSKSIPNLNLNSKLAVGPFQQYRSNKDLPSMVDLHTQEGLGNFRSLPRNIRDGGSALRMAQLGAASSNRYQEGGATIDQVVNQLSGCLQGDMDQKVAGKLKDTLSFLMNVRDGQQQQQQQQKTASPGATPAEYADPQKQHTKLLGAGFSSPLQHLGSPSNEDCLIEDGQGVRRPHFDSEIDTFNQANYQLGQKVMEGSPSQPIGSYQQYFGQQQLNVGGGSPAGPQEGQLTQRSQDASVQTDLQQQQQQQMMMMVPSGFTAQQWQQIQLMQAGAFQALPQNLNGGAMVPGLMYPGLRAQGQSQNTAIGDFQQRRYSQQPDRRQERTTGEFLIQNEADSGQKRFDNDFYYEDFNQNGERIVKRRDGVAMDRLQSRRGKRSQRSQQPRNGQGNLSGDEQSYSDDNLEPAGSRRGNRGGNRDRVTRNSPRQQREDRDRRHRRTRGYQGGSDNYSENDSPDRRSGDIKNDKYSKCVYEEVIVIDKNGQKQIKLRKIRKKKRRTPSGRELEGYSYSHSSKDGVEVKQTRNLQATPLDTETPREHDVNVVEGMTPTFIPTKKNKQTTPGSGGDSSIQEKKVNADRDTPELSGGDDWHRGSAGLVPGHKEEQGQESGAISPELNLVPHNGVNPIRQTFGVIDILNDDQESEDKMSPLPPIVVEDKRQQREKKKALTQNMSRKLGSTNSFEEGPHPEACFGSSGNDIDEIGRGSVDSPLNNRTRYGINSNKGEGFNLQGRKTVDLADYNNDQDELQQEQEEGQGNRKGVRSQRNSSNRPGTSSNKKRAKNTSGKKASRGIKTTTKTSTKTKTQKNNLNGSVDDVEFVLNGETYQKTDQNNHPSRSGTNPKNSKPFTSSYTGKPTTKTNTSTINNRSGLSKYELVGVGSNPNPKSKSKNKLSSQAQVPKLKINSSSSRYKEGSISNYETSAKRTNQNKKSEGPTATVVVKDSSSKNKSQKNPNVNNPNTNKLGGGGLGVYQKLTKEIKRKSIRDIMGEMEGYETHVDPELNKRANHNHHQEFQDPIPEGLMGGPSTGRSKDLHEQLEYRPDNLTSKVDLHYKPMNLAKFLPKTSGISYKMKGSTEVIKRRRSRVGESPEDMFRSIQGQYVPQAPRRRAGSFKKKGKRTVTSSLRVSGDNLGEVGKQEGNLTARSRTNKGIGGIPDLRAPKRPEIKGRAQTSGKRVKGSSGIASRGPKGERLGNKYSSPIGLSQQQRKNTNSKSNRPLNSKTGEYSSYNNPTVKTTDNDNGKNTTLGKNKASKNVSKSSRNQNYRPGTISSSMNPVKGRGGVNSTRNGGNSTIPVFGDSNQINTSNTKNTTRPKVGARSKQQSSRISKNQKFSRPTTAKPSSRKQQQQQKTTKTSNNTTNLFKTGSKNHTSTFRSPQNNTRKPGAHLSSKPNSRGNKTSTGGQQKVGSPQNMLSSSPQDMETPTTPNGTLQSPNKKPSKSVKDSEDGNKIDPLSDHENKSQRRQHQPRYNKPEIDEKFITKHYDENDDEQDAISPIQISKRVKIKGTKNEKGSYLQFFEGPEALAGSGSNIDGRNDGAGRKQYKGIQLTRGNSQHIQRVQGKSDDDNSDDGEFDDIDNYVPPLSVSAAPRQDPKYMEFHNHLKNISNRTQINVNNIALHLARLFGGGKKGGNGMLSALKKSLAKQEQANKAKQGGEYKDSSYSSDSGIGQQKKKEKKNKKSKDKTGKGGVKTKAGLQVFDHGKQQQQHQQGGEQSTSSHWQKPSDDFDQKKRQIAVSSFHNPADDDVKQQKSLAKLGRSGTVGANLDFGGINSSPPPNAKQQAQIPNSTNKNNNKHVSSFNSPNQPPLNSGIMINPTNNQSISSEASQMINSRVNQLNKERKGEDDWDKISRISKCTSVKKQPLKLEGLSNNIRKLRNVQMNVEESMSRIQISKNKTHNMFLDSSIPLSERFDALAGPKGSKFKTVTQIGNSSTFNNVNGQKDPNGSPARLQSTPGLSKMGRQALIQKSSQRTKKGHNARESIDLNLQNQNESRRVSSDSDSESSLERTRFDNSSVDNTNKDGDSGRPGSQFNLPDMEQIPTARQRLSVAHGVRPKGLGLRANFGTKGKLFFIFFIG